MQENLAAALTDGFTDVIWTDEMSVQLESHRDAGSTGVEMYADTRRTADSFVVL